MIVLYALGGILLIVVIVGIWRSPTMDPIEEAIYDLLWDGEWWHDGQVVKEIIRRLPTALPGDILTQLRVMVSLGKVERSEVLEIRAPDDLCRIGQADIGGRLTDDLRIIPHEGDDAPSETTVCYHRLSDQGRRKRRRRQEKRAAAASDGLLPAFDPIAS